MKPVIPSDCFLIGGKAPDDVGFTKTYTGEAMSQQDERDGVSRRRVLQAAASIVTLHFGSYLAPALARFGMAGTAQQQGDDLLASGRAKPSRASEAATSRPRHTSRNC